MQGSRAEPYSIVVGLASVELGLVRRSRRKEIGLMRIHRSQNYSIAVMTRTTACCSQMGFAECHTETEAFSIIASATLGRMDFASDSHNTVSCSEGAHYSDPDGSTYPSAS